MRSIYRGAMQYLWGRGGERRIDGFRVLYKMRTHLVLRSRSIGTRVNKAVRRDVRLFVDGKKSFSRIVRLIRGARATLVIQMFIWKDDETGRMVAQAVLDAADRGVVVDITKEGVGDLFEKEHDFFATQFESSDLWQRFWSHPNIRVHYVDNHDHAKVYVIDNHTLVLTGMNIADEYRFHWHDYMVELRGTHFVEHFLTAQPPQGDELTLVMNRAGRRDIRPFVMRLIRSAQKSIVLEHCYLSDDAVISALLERNAAGVRVTVIVPEHLGLHHHSNMQSVGRLMTGRASSNLQVLLYPRVFHAKVMLIDRTAAFLGSANMMRSSLDDMGEVNVYVGPGHSGFISDMREALREDILISRPLAALPPLRWASRWLAYIGL